MDYRDDIRTIEDSIMELNDAIRRLNGAKESLEKDPDNEELQNEVETLTAEVERDYSISRRLFATAMRRYHPDINDNVTEESKEAVVRLNELNDRIRRIEREIHSSDSSDEIEEESKENDSKDITPNSNDEKETVKDETKDHPIADIFLNDRNITPPSKDESDEFIPGTNFRKPRARGIHETDEEYVQFLNDYYTNLFQKVVSENKTSDREVDDLLQPTSLAPVKEKKKENNIIQKNHKDKTKNPKLGQSDVKQIEGDVKPNPTPVPNPNSRPNHNPNPSPNSNPTPVPSTGNDPDKNPPRTLERIIADLGKDLSITKKDQKCLAVNIQVDKSFKEELKTGNWLYNVVHVVPAAIKSAATVVNKYWSKFTTTKEQRENITELTDRINKLPDEDLDIIYNEYRGSKVIQERFPSVINILLQQKIKSYALNKIENLDNENTVGYRNAFATYEQVRGLNDKINDPNTPDTERQLYINQKENLLNGTIDQIKSIRENYIQANKWMSGGYHGFEEDMKASATKLNIVGKRFAVNHDYDNELQEKLADLSDAEKLAIKNGDAETALNAFIEREMVESENTKIENSIFGKRSTGKKYYSPLAEQLNYSDDPFVRDMFTTIAVAGATVSAFNAVKTHVHDANQVLSNQQAHAAQVNASNNATMNQVHQTGQNIADKRVEFTEGIKAQAHFDVNNYGMTGERRVLDTTGGGYGWNYSSPLYGQEDAAQHFATHNLSDYVNNEHLNISSQVAAGTMDKATALSEFAKVTANTQQHFQGMLSNYMGTLTQYAQNNPQFDLAGVQDAFQYILSNPQAITNMNQAAIDVTNLGESLIGLTAAQVTALKSLPSDMMSTIFADAAAISLATNVSSTMSNNAKTGKYGNVVTELVGDYRNKEGSSGKTR